MTDVTHDASERHTRLLGIKLRTLVAEHLGRSIDSQPVGYPNGAALVVDDAAWVFVDGDASRSLGGALAWALRQPVSSLSIVAEADTGLLARRAEHVAFAVSVWFAQGRSLLPAMAEPLAAPEPPEPDHIELTDVIVRAGASPNVEHGVVFGEVYGLEVCRVVDEPTVGHIAELGDVATLDAPLELPDTTLPDGVLLEVGVGANDREAFRMLHGDVPTVEALASVVEAVATVRSPDAPQHPLNRLGQERFLRWRLEQDPALIDMTQVEPGEPPVPRPNLKDPVPCVAVGVDSGGRSSTIVCSVGVDLDLIGFVADAQAAAGRPVVVVLKERDVLPITTELLGLLRRPVEIRTV